MIYGRAYFPLAPAASERFLYNRMSRSELNS